jgi:ABC-type branched-subunit amino acid transport system ATPase component/predicted MFS family arabinose efflux permease
VRARGWRSLDGHSAYPLGVLSGLYLVDQIDTQAFNVLSPEIKQTFGLTSTGLALVFAINFVVVLGGSIFVGWLADRLSRVRMVLVLSVVAAVGSILTGLAPVVAFLVVARLINGAGLVGTQPIHRSLLSDWYSVRSRGVAFAIHQSADSFGTVIAPLLVAVLGTAFGWRAVFVVLAVPIILVLLLAARLKEPLRGVTDDAVLAEQTKDEKPLKFEQAVRTLAQSRTLRRTWLGLVFFGGAFLPISAFGPLFMHSVFGLTLLQRGVAGVIASLFAVAGLLVAGRWVQRRMEIRPADVQTAAGLSLIGVAAAVAMLAVAPNVPAAVFAFSLIGFIAGFFIPSTAVIQAYVTPARVRSQGFAFGALFIAAGAFIAPLAGGVADGHGLRTGLLAFTPLLLIGGIVIASASRFVDSDRAAAMHAMEVAAQLREQRASDGEHPLLVCQGVDVSYGSVQVLFGVDFQVRKGEIVALLGTNGAGKSTLLKAVSGLLRPDRGLIFFDGDDVTALAPWETSARGIVLMPGGKSVFPLMTVGENLRLAGWLFRRDQAFIDERTELVLQMFPRLRERYKQQAGNLSGGEQQMVSLAQAFIAKPELLMIDELSLGLAPKIVGELLDVIRAIHAEGVTVILVEQSVNVALTVAERAYFLEKGEVRFSGPTAELLEREDVLRSVFLEGAAKAAALA